MARNRHSLKELIFWAIVAFFLIFLGIEGIKANYVNRMDDWTGWIIPGGLMVIGGMILGVTISDFKTSIGGKNGKEK